MRWLKQIFSPTPETFYSYAMKNSRFRKRLTFQQIAAMHDSGQVAGAQYLCPIRLPNGMIGFPHSMIGEYVFLQILCDSEGDERNKEQLDIAFEKFQQEFYKQERYNFSKIM